MTQPSTVLKYSLLPEMAKLWFLSKKSPLSETGKHTDFQVTSCLQNDTTDVDFAYIES
jgi:hypothetical protein